MEVVAPFTRQMAERCGVLQMKSRARTRNAQAQRKTCSSSTSIVPLVMNWRYTSSRWYVRDFPTFPCRLSPRTIACSIPKYETQLSQFSVLPRFCEETPEAHTQQGPIHACCFTVGNARTQSKIKAGLTQPTDGAVSLVTWSRTMLRKRNTSRVLRVFPSTAL